MDMDQAAVFFAASILTALGFLVWILLALIVNNLVSKYWKSWGWKWNIFYTEQTTRFMTDEEAARVAPTLESEKKKK